jgi:hypothetical protein
LQFLAPFTWLNTHWGGPAGAPPAPGAAAAAPHAHTVAGLPAEAYERAAEEEGHKRHVRLFRQPNVDPAESLVRDTRPILQQMRHKGHKGEGRHPADEPLLYHPHK